MNWLIIAGLIVVLAWLLEIADNTDAYATDIEIKQKSCEWCKRDTYGDRSIHFATGHLICFNCKYEDENRR